MDCNLPCSPVHGILQARILEWVAMPSSRESSWPRDQTLCLLHWQADSEALATYDRKDPDKTGLDKEEKAGELQLAETPSTKWRGMACRWRETTAMCTENRMYRKPHVQRTACAERQWVQSQGNWLRCPRVPAGPMSCDTDTFPPRMTGRYGRVWITGQERHRRGRRVKREVYPYGRFMLRRGRNQHNIVKQLSPN